MNKRKLLLMLVCCCIFTACGSEVADVGGTSAQVENSTTAEETETAEKMSDLTADELLDLFLAGEVLATYPEGTKDAFSITDLSGYTVGESVDLDNDGESELILDGSYGGMYLDAREGQVFVLAEGSEESGTLKYGRLDEQTWIVYCNTSDRYEDKYDFVLYDGTGQSIDKFQLSKKYEVGVDRGTEYFCRGEQITKDDYYSFLLETLEEEVIRGIHWRTKEEMAEDRLWLYGTDTLSTELVQAAMKAEDAKYCVRRKDSVLTSYRVYGAGCAAGITKCKADGAELEFENIWKEDVDIYSLIKSYLQKRVLIHDTHESLVENYDEIIEEMDSHPENWYWYMDATGVVIVFRYGVLRVGEATYPLYYSEWADYLKEEYLPDMSEIIGVFRSDERLELGEGQFVEISGHPQLMNDEVMRTECAEVAFGYENGDCTEGFLLNDAKAGCYVLINTEGETAVDDASLLVYSILDGQITLCDYMPLAVVDSVNSWEDLTLTVRVEGTEDWNYTYEKRKYRIGEDGKLVIL